MTNKEIREAAKAAGVKIWQIADMLGIMDYTLSRKMRYELPEAEKQKILQIIEQLSKEVTA